MNHFLPYDPTIGIDPEPKIEGKDGRFYSYELVDSMTPCEQFELLGRIINLKKEKL